MNPPVRSETAALERAEVRVLGTRLHAVDRAQALAWVDAWIQAGTRAHIATVNPEFVMRARRDHAFHALLNRTRLNLPDGIGILLAAGLRRAALPERVTGVDLVHDISKLAARRGSRMLLVGGAPGIAAGAARELARAHPGLPLPDAHVGSPDPDGDDEAQRVLAEVAPQVVFVAYGAPAQEFWIERNISPTMGVVALGVGGALDYVSGKVPRAPIALRALGLEWAFRLWRQPSRWRRMRVLPAFAFLAAREALGADRRGKR